MAKKNQQTSVDRTLRECEAMVNYALSQGQKVPPHVLATLEKYRLYKDYMVHLDNASSDSRNVNPKPHPFEKYLMSQVVRLEGNVATRNLAPSDVVVPSEEEMVNDLTMVHQDLVDAVAPATPATVCLFEDQKRRPLRFLGPVPLVQQLTIVSLLCLLTFLGLFLFDQVDAKSVNSNILDIQDPLTFVLNELVIISIAAAGASFYALFEAYKYIANASYDEKYESIYWIRFILGIMSGVILAQFIFIDPSAYGGSSAEVNTSQSVGGFLTYRPLLAFLGGFSARVVHKILNSLVDSLETFISGSARDMLRAREEQAKVQINEKVATIKRENAINEANQRFQAALKLMKLQEELSGSKSDPEQLKQSIQKLINEQLNAVGVPTTENTNTTTTTQPTPETNFGSLPVVGPEDIHIGEEPGTEHTETTNMTGDTEVITDANETKIGDSGVGGEGINIDLGGDFKP